jgi:hypothetical protein
LERASDFKDAQHNSLAALNRRWSALLLHPNALERFESQRFPSELGDSGKLETAPGRAP